MRVIKGKGGKCQHCSIMATARQIAAVRMNWRAESTAFLTRSGQRTFGAAFPPVVAFTQSNISCYPAWQQERLPASQNLLPLHTNLLRPKQEERPLSMSADERRNLPQ